MPDPTTIQSARLAIGQIRDAWPHLASAAIPGKSGPSMRTLTASAAADLDALVRAERADRLPNAKAGHVPLASLPAPVRLGVIDCEVAVRGALTDLMWRTASALRLDAELSRPAVTRDITPVCGWLSATIARLSQPDAEHAAAVLSAAARVLHLTLELEPRWVWLTRRCPACKRRTLRQWAASPKRPEWTVECVGEQPACRCVGQGCACGREDGRKASVHLWPAETFQRRRKAA